MLILPLIRKTNLKNLVHFYKERHYTSKCFKVKDAAGKPGEDVMKSLNIVFF